MIRILLIFSAFIVACGSSIAYGDYVDTTGWSRKQIESIKNHPKTQIGIASYYGKKFHKKLTANGETFNINADTAAGAIASALKAERILLLTDVEGVLDSEKKLISSISTTQAESMINKKIITGGMIPKIETCLETVAAGVKAAVIIDGRSPHAILREIFTTSGSGTMIE